MISSALHTSLKSGPSGAPVSSKRVKADMNGAVEEAEISVFGVAWVPGTRLGTRFGSFPSSCPFTFRLREAMATRAGGSREAAACTETALAEGASNSAAASRVCLATMPGSACSPYVASLACP